MDVCDVRGGGERFERQNPEGHAAAFLVQRVGVEAQAAVDARWLHAGSPGECDLPQGSLAGDGL